MTRGEKLAAKIGLIRTYVANQHKGIRASILNKLGQLEDELKHCLREDLEYDNGSATYGEVKVQYDQYIEEAVDGETWELLECNDRDDMEELLQSDENDIPEDEFTRRLFVNVWGVA
nr:MAG TPA: hypothetical protein [Caudoviricetes sp.]